MSAKPSMKHSDSDSYNANLRGYALQTQGLVKRFGGITATDHVTLNIAHGVRHALIGPNGAGKTTLINLMTGVLPATEGRIVLQG
jgi:branched-chain amino acid transport system ATP-binding protein